MMKNPFPLLREGVGKRMGLAYFTISLVILARVRRLRMAEEMSRKLSFTAGSIPSSSQVVP